MMPVRDIVVVGASAAGFEALQVLAAGMPANFGGAVFVTVAPVSAQRRDLARMLSNAGPLTAVNAEDGIPVETGRIYVAPPDYHLVLQNGFMQLSHGPKENLQIPCINVMFRSAATAYGERVAGVILTGLLDDGAAGLWEIQQHQGATIVQDPEEATFRSMPDSAIRGLNEQYIVGVREMAPLLQRLSSQAGIDSAATTKSEPHFERSGQICPECGGVMRKATLGNLLEFRCHTGHRFGLRSLISEKSELVEQALYGALAQSEELTELLRAAVAEGNPEDAALLRNEIERRGREQDLLRSLTETTREASQFLR